MNDGDNQLRKRNTFILALSFGGFDPLSTGPVDKTAGLAVSQGRKGEGN